MSAEIPTNSPEKKELLDDNARKFTLGTIDPEFLQKHNAKSFLLTTDWLEMGESSEKKLAHKKYENGDVEILLIQKFTQDGKRTVPPKEKLTENQYQEFLASSPALHVEKIRHEFDYIQNGISFSVKYDEFIGSELRVLEVDAQDEAERDSFEPKAFPYDLMEVTGDIRYYGYRVATVL
jgi:hypothetical protein